jgi:hypothetical protein
LLGVAKSIQTAGDEPWDILGNIRRH